MTTPNTITMQGVIDTVKSASYYRLGETTNTICLLQLKNGYSAYGHSACVDPANYNQALGEKYAYEDALRKIWPLEGYLLAERLHAQVRVNV